MPVLPDILVAALGYDNFSNADVIFISVKCCAGSFNACNIFFYKNESLLIKIVLLEFLAQRATVQSQHDRRLTLIAAGVLHNGFQ